MICSVRINLALPTAVVERLFSRFVKRRWKIRHPEQEAASRRARVNRRYATDPVFRAAVKARAKTYRLQNLPAVQERERSYEVRVRRAKAHVLRHAHRMQEDLSYRLRYNLRKRFRAALYGQSKRGSAVRDLGCPIEDFRRYLEALWEPGMSWDNYGCRAGQWSIDHRKPLSAFDLTDPAQVKEACLFINLQPMWVVDNVRKGASRLT